MKVTGKNPRLFIGDKEIESISSFSFDNSADFLEVKFPFSERETIEFTGVYDPACVDGESWESISAKLENGFMGTITLPNGEKRDALLQGSYKDGTITIEPVDAETREWIKKSYGW